jgi:hypothetical protein
MDTVHHTEQRKRNAGPTVRGVLGAILGLLAFKALLLVAASV